MKKSVYIIGSGTLKQHDHTIQFIRKDNEKKTIPIKLIDHIHVFGEVSINKRFLELLSSENVGVTFYSYYGKIVGRYTPDHNKIGKTILAQSESWLNVKKRNQIIQYIEKNSFESCDKFVNSCEQNPETETIHKFIQEYYRQLNNIDTGIDHCGQRVLLLEARMKQKYYRIFDAQMHNNTAFRFGHRSVYPADNEVNAVLSFGYALLYAEILCAIEQSSLVPCISFIHGNSRNNKGSLQFDIADMLKPQAVDALVIRLFNNALLSNSHFEYDKGVYLNEIGREIFLNSFQNHLESSADADTGYSNKYTIHKSVYDLQKAIINEAKKKGTYHYDACDCCI